MGWSSSPTATPIITSEFPVTTELPASGAPAPSSISPPEAPTPGKVLSTSPASAGSWPHTLIGIIPTKSRCRGQGPNWRSFLGASCFPLGDLESIWFWDLTGFITRLKRLGRQFFCLCRRWGFFDRPSTARGCPWLLSWPTTAAATWAGTPSGLCSALTTWWWWPLAPAPTTPWRFAPSFRSP